jgi:DNA primase
MESGRIPEEALQAIRTRVSILDVVSPHVALKRAGRNWTGLCPFHAEKTPSFVVNEERGSYHCFGCGAGGNAFRFLMEVEGRTFRDAAECLAERAGIRLELKPEGPEEKKRKEERDLLLEVLELAARYYRHQLVAGRAGGDARGYLVRREIADDASERFRLGYAPSGWDTLARYLKKKGVDLALCARAGLLAERKTGGGYYDRLRDRLVFPISDASGRVVSFGGRALGAGGEEPKYLNGPESTVFRKSETLYGLPQAQETLRKERRAILVEGYLDVVSLHARGCRAALATLGTSLTSDHVLALRRRVDEAVLVYDGDAAGRKAAFRSLSLFLGGGLACRAVLLPAEHDPDSFARAGGDLGALVAGAKPLFEEFLSDLGDRFELSRVEGKLAAVDALKQALEEVQDPLARELFARQASEALGVSEEHLVARLRTPSPPEADHSREEPAPDPLERHLLECLLFEPSHREKFVSRGLAEGMVPGVAREACLFVAARQEEAALLPVENAPAEVRRLLSAILVETSPRRSFEALATALRQRELEARRLALAQHIRKAEQAGDADEVRRLQRDKIEIDRTLLECRKRSGS